MIEGGGLPAVSPALPRPEALPFEQRIYKLLLVLHIPGHVCVPFARHAAPRAAAHTAPARTCAAHSVIPRPQRGAARDHVGPRGGPGLRSRARAPCRSPGACWVGWWRLLTERSRCFAEPSNVCTAGLRRRNTPHERADYIVVRACAEALARCLAQAPNPRHAFFYLLFFLRDSRDG